MIEINGYQVYEEQSTPIRTVYRGHHKTRQPHRSCTIQAIFEEDVPQSYRQLMKYSNYYIPETQILLRHIFTSPQHPHHIFFVQYEPTQFRNYLDLHLQRRFLRVFQIVTSLVHILRRGFVHDLSLENIAIGKETTYFYNFVITGKKQMEASQIKRQTQILIAQLLGNEEDNLGEFTVKIDQNFDNLCLDWQKKIGQSDVSMRYFFKLGQSNKEVISVCSKLSKNGTEKNWYKQIAASELLAFIPYYDSSSSKWRLPSLADESPIESGLQADEAGGMFGGQAAIIDNEQGYPFNTVGAISSLLKSHSQQRKRFGTAVLVGQNLIITCAHNIQCNIQDEVYKADVKDIIFTYNQKDYKIQGFRLHDKFRQNIKSNARYEYDYALIKLVETIDLKLFVEVAHNYTDKDESLKLKGFYGREDEKTIRSKLIPVFKFCFQKQKQLKYHYGSKEEASEGGFSGAPIFIILAEQLDLKLNFKYHLMIGIHNSGYKGINGYATFFTKEIINDFAKWQQELTPGGQRFKHILNFQKITNLDEVCEDMRARLDEIVFNPTEMKYFPKLFAQVKYEKQIDRGYIEGMYKQAVHKELGYGQKANEVLLEMGSFKYQSRHNNIMFMYHLRNYENWFAPWQSYGESLGLTVFYIYMALQLEFFFAQAKVCKQKEQQFKKFQEFLSDQIEKSYDKRGYSMQAALKIHSKINDFQYWLKEISMNSNFRKLLFMEVQFMKCLARLSAEMIIDAKLFQVSKICVLGFLAKELFAKVAEINQPMKHYLFVFNELILVSIKYLLDEEKFLEAREAKFSFAWSVRKLVKDHPYLCDDFLRFDPSHQVLLSEEQREKRENIENMIKTHLFGEQVKTYLRNCMAMLFK